VTLENFIYTYTSNFTGQKTVPTCPDRHREIEIVVSDQDEEKEHGHLITDYISFTTALRVFSIPPTIRCAEPFADNAT